MQSYQKEPPKEKGKKVIVYLLINSFSERNACKKRRKEFTDRPVTVVNGRSRRDRVKGKKRGGMN